jgi:hypothetical protein
VVMVGGFFWSSKFKPRQKFENSDDPSSKQGGVGEVRELLHVHPTRARTQDLDDVRRAASAGAQAAASRPRGLKTEWCVLQRPH